MAATDVCRACDLITTRRMARRPGLPRQRQGRDRRPAARTRPPCRCTACCTGKPAWPPRAGDADLSGAHLAEAQHAARRITRGSDYYRPAFDTDSANLGRGPGCRAPGRHRSRRAGCVDRAVQLDQAARTGRPPPDRPRARSPAHGPLQTRYHPQVRETGGRWTCRTKAPFVRDVAPRPGDAALPGQCAGRTPLSSFGVAGRVTEAVFVPPAMSTACTVLVAGSLT
jgi:hypothetical protein